MIRVAIVDDHQAIAEALGALIEDTPGITVVGTAHDRTSASALIQRLSPDVVICDVQLRSAADGIEVLAEHGSRSLFIMLSAYTHPDYVVTSIRHGARGYLSKLASIEEIVAAIRTVAAGGSAFRDEARQAIRTSLPRPTSREMAILVPLAEGRSYAEIAVLESFGVRTVESSIRRMFLRYGVTNRVALIRLGQRQGWIDEGR